MPIRRNNRCIDRETRICRGAVSLHRHGRYVIQYRVKERREVFALFIRITRRCTRPSRTEYDRAVELFVGGVEIDEKFQNFVLHLRDARVGAVDLFTTIISLWLSSSAFCMTKRVCGMGPSAASTSNNTPFTILSTRSTSPPKSAWPGVSIIFILTRDNERCVLCEDRDAAFAFEAVGNHHSLFNDLIFPECSALPEHLIHERRLAVVDVRDDCHVP